MPEEKNKDLIRKITKAKNENDEDQLRALFDSDFVAHISDWPNLMDLEEYIASVKFAHEAFNPLTFEIEEMIAEGDKISVRLVVKGKHTGAYEHFLATNHDVCFYIMLMRRIVDGKVKEEWQVNDHLTMLKQMGLSVNHII